MPYAAHKHRLTFAELCRCLDRSGFRIVSMSQYDLKEALDLGPKRHLQLVVMNRNNLAVEVKGPITPPYYGEDLFYKVAGQEASFEDSYGR